MTKERRFYGELEIERAAALLEKWEKELTRSFLVELWDLDELHIFATEAFQRDFRADIAEQVLNDISPRRRGLIAAVLFVFFAPAEAKIDFVLDEKRRDGIVQRILKQGGISVFRPGREAFFLEVVE